MSTSALLAPILPTSSGRCAWLDGQNQPLVRFETEADADMIIMKVQFDGDGLAELFRQAFQGLYSG